MKGFLCLRTRQNSAPKRVAIVGGGCAGMSAAWQLSRQPGYVIDVYESSWRLGGKAASVRDKDGRILDHGLHVWLGFYENAFRMMRECYAEVGERSLGPLTHRSFDEAFLPGAARGRRQSGTGRPRLDGLVLLLPAGEGRAGRPSSTWTAIPTRSPATCCAASACSRPLP